MGTNPSVGLVNHRVVRMRYVQKLSLTSPSTHNLWRSFQCTWVKNNARKPRTEAYIESLQKQIKDFRKRYLEVRQYAKYLESQLDVCSQYHHPNVDFRANRPQEYDALLGKEDDSDIMMGRDDNDQNSDIGIDSKVMAISIPPQSLQVR